MKQKGITLIALVITIIVLLILAGVAISTLTGNENILKNAGTTVDQYNEKAEAEEAVLNTLENRLIEYSNGGETSAPPSVDANGLATAPYPIKPTIENSKNIQIVIPIGFAPVVLTEGNNPGQNGSVASIMPADQWSSITATQIDQGIVVVDHEITYDNGQTSGTVPDFNEYVWVPITGSGRNIFDPYPWTTRYGYDSTGNLVDGGDTGMVQLLEDTSRENYFWEDKTAIEYINMVTSISRNKGFYISRYEASNNGSGVAQSKRGQAAWTGITQNNKTGIGAIQASANNPTANTHLMYGIEWDSTLNWLIGNATISSSTVGNTKTMEESDIQTNSCSWGNYYNSTGDATTGKGSKRNTGYSEYWKANNIYDLAGNVYEWTQEKYSTKSTRVRRGGACDKSGINSPAADRNINSELTTNYSLRFPLQFLLVALYSGFHNKEKNINDNRRWKILFHKGKRSIKS